MIITLSNHVLHIEEDEHDLRVYAHEIVRGMERKPIAYMMGVNCLELPSHRPPPRPSIGQSTHKKAVGQ